MSLITNVKKKISKITIESVLKFSKIQSYIYYKLKSISIIFIYVIWSDTKKIFKSQ